MVSYGLVLGRGSRYLVHVMNPRPTIKDVARRAKVATGTVSRVTNGDTTVHPVIRDAVEAAIKELGYRPSPIARNLRRGRSGIIGFVLADISNPTYGPMVPEVQELTREAGYTLIVMDSAMDPERERRNLETLAALRVDGVVLNPLLPVDTGIPELLQGIPVVSLPGVPEWEGAKVRAVSTNATLAGLDDCLENGHRRLAFLTIKGLGGTQRDILSMMRDRIRAAGATFVSDASWTFVSREQCAEQLPAMLAAPGRPTAVLTASALLPGLLIAAREAGMKVPRDLSVVSIATSELADAYDPPINVVSFDARGLSSEAVCKLLTAMRGEEPGEAVENDSRYIRRGSVGPAPQ